MPGRTISRANMQRIQQIADHAYAMGAKAPPPDSRPLGSKADMSLGDQMDAVSRAVYRMSDAPMDGYCCVEEIFDSYVIIEVCERGMETYWRADYTTGENGAVTLAARDAWVQVEEQWVEVSAASAKAGLEIQDDTTSILATMKAAGERQIDVCIAFGGPRAKDAHGEYFSPNTDMAEADFPSPPLIYYHGYDQRTNKAMSKPVVIGKPVQRWNSDTGHHIRYQLKANRYADQTWADAQGGPVPASPGTVGYLIRKAPDGELLYWPIAEVSAWDRAGGRKQAYHHTVATAALKALYLQEGLTIPETLSTAPEAAGDAAAVGGVDIDPQSAGRAVADAIAAALRSDKGL